MIFNDILIGILIVILISTIYSYIFGYYVKNKTKQFSISKENKIDLFDLEKATQEIFSYYGKPKIFFSYSIEDKTFSERLARDIQERGIQTWLTWQEIKSGDNWQFKIDEALKTSGYFFAIISKSSVESSSNQKELEMAVKKEKETKLPCIIPILLEDVEIPENIRDKLYVDFRDDYQHGLKKILEIFDDRFYLTKNQMRDLIINLTDDLYQYENIPPEVMELHKMHAIPDLFNEPFREDLNIKFSYLNQIEHKPNFFTCQRSFGFKVFNTARSDTKEKNYKLINKNGLIHAFSEPIYDELLLNGPNEKIKEYLLKCLDVEFDCINGSNIIKYSPFFISYDEFDGVERMPKGSDDNKLYAVYQLQQDEAQEKRIRISFYFNILIPPGESLGITLKYKSISKNFNIILFDFPSYTNGFNFELDFGDKFMTDIASSIFGRGYISRKSKNNFSYSGWILPHSSISCSWNKINYKNK